MKHRSFRAFLSILLAVSMLLQLASPVSAESLSELISETGAATENAANEENDASYPEDPSDPEEKLRQAASFSELNDSIIIGEASERREESTKHFRLTDSSYGAVMYPFAVHEKTASGEWLEIDNTLRLMKAKDGSTFYVCSNLSSDTSFALIPTSEQLLTVRLPEGSISWSLFGISEHVKAGYYEEQKPEEGYTKLMVKSLSGDLTYTDILPETDLVYQLQGHEIKEDIVLRSREAVSASSEPGVYTFLLQTEGLKAEFKEGVVLL